MSYSIEVEEQAAERLRRVPDELAAVIVEQIDRLGENPGLGLRIHDGILEGRMLYSFVVEAGPRVYRLAVLYQFGSDERTLFITEVGPLIGDGDRMHLGEAWPPP